MEILCKKPLTREDLSWYAFSFWIMRRVFMWRRAKRIRNHLAACRECRNRYEAGPLTAKRLDDQRLEEAMADG